MLIKNDDVIYLIKSIGDNLILGRSLERSLFLAIKTLPSCIENKENWLNMINMGCKYSDVFQNIAENTLDNSLSRVWLLLSKMSLLSTSESGEKLLEIAKNLEKNKILVENRNSIVRAQRYKLLFLGSITSLFLGIIAGLAPLFATFMSLIKDTNIPGSTINLIPISLFVISETSVYFISDIGFGKINYKSFVLSCIAYFLAFFVTKGIIILLL